MHVKHRSFIFVVQKNYPVNNYMLKIDIKSTRTRCEILHHDFFTIAEFKHVLVC